MAGASEGGQGSSLAAMAAKAKRRSELAALQSSPVDGTVQAVVREFDNTALLVVDAGARLTESTGKVWGILCAIFFYLW